MKTNIFIVSISAALEVTIVPEQGEIALEESKFFLCQGTFLQNGFSPQDKTESCTCKEESKCLLILLPVPPITRLMKRKLRLKSSQVPPGGSISLSLAVCSGISTGPVMTEGAAGGATEID